MSNLHGALQRYSLEVLLDGGGRWELYGSSGGWVGGSGGCYHSCRQDDDPVLGNKISQVSSRQGRGGSRRGAKAMTAGRRNRLHKEVCLQKQTGTGGNWYNTVKINQYDLLSGGRSFRGRCFESINCCRTWGALDTHLLGPVSAAWDVSGHCDNQWRLSTLYSYTRNGPRVLRRRISCIRGFRQNFAMASEHRGVCLSLRDVVGQRWLGCTSLTSSRALAEARRPQREREKTTDKQPIVEFYTLTSV